MSDPTPQPEDRVERVLQTFWDEPMLWPVAAAMLLTAMTFGAAILFWAVRLRAIVPGLVLLILIFVTVWGLDQDIRKRRLRLANRVVLAVWLGSATAAFALEWLGAFQ